MWQKLLIVFLSIYSLPLLLLLLAVTSFAFIYADDINKAFDYSNWDSSSKLMVLGILAIISTCIYFILFSSYPL